MPEPRPFARYVWRYLGRLLRLFLGAFARSLGSWAVWLPVLALIWAALGAPTLVELIEAAR